MAIGIRGRSRFERPRWWPAAAGLLGATLGGIGVGVAHVSRAARDDSASEARVRERVDDWAKAIIARDVDRVMSFYTPDIVSFDLDPPLRYTGAARKRRAWQEFFGRFTGPLSYEVHELTIKADGKLAFVHSLNHVSGTLSSGHKTDLWVRWTACFQSTGNSWSIVHDHASVPADVAHARAVLDLTP